ncbi:MAG: TasA family protein [Clostridiales bacterium]|jgi:predicted ribosomally synthesized peptide with SipW-like signal peptide|nr:CalY family protein [Eubacteriales bacterium]MDH7566493.1 TasA family protein [Clostridiales bacterium]
MKKRLMMALAFTVIGAMLIAGGTFALFTATVSNGGNTFTSGTVVITQDKAQGQIFANIANIAPGDRGSGTITVRNEGTLELRYDIAQSLTGALAEGVNGLKVTIKDANGNVIIPGTDNNRILAANGGSEVLTVEWALPLEADNHYQGATAALALTFNAEQTKNNP